MDGTYKVVLVWTLVQTLYQVSHTCPDLSISLSHSSVGDETVAPTGGIQVNWFRDPQFEVEDKCRKWSLDAWLHNLYIFAFWKASRKCGIYCKCSVDDIQKAISVPVDGKPKTPNKFEKIKLPLNVLNIQNCSYSSVWCHSSPESGLQCRFQNLYYNLFQKEFVFLYSLNSTVYGIESVRSLQTNLYLSSVIKHTAFQLPITVLTFSTFVANYKAKLIPGKSLLMSRFKPDNLLHIFHDDLLPIYFTVQEICMGVMSCIEDINLFIFDEHDQGKHWDLYSSLYKRTRLMSELSLHSTDMWYCFENAYIGLNKLSVWYQYGFEKFQGPQVKNTFSGPLLRQFTSYVKEKLKLQQLPTSDPVGVLFSRKFNRKILNEREVSSIMKEQLRIVSGQVDSHVKLLSLEENDLSTIISELSQARVAVGVHGAALILGMFLSPGAVLVEIWPFGIDHIAATVYKTMCQLKHFDVIYIPWANEDLENTVFHPEYPSFYGGLNHLTITEQKNIISALYENKIEGLKCCDNENWLFRIYQDTKVHVSESDSEFKSIPFSKVLREGLRTSKKYLLSNGQEEKNNIHELVYPSKVQEFHCSLIRDAHFTKLYLDWRDPWNIENINCDKIAFEIFIAVDGSAAVRYVVSERRYLKKLNLKTETVNTWVTCICNDVEGAVMYKQCIL